MERNFETVMIEQCAPVLASLKPAGLFRYETRDCADLARRVKNWNAQLEPKGLRVRVLKKKRSGFARSIQGFDLPIGFLWLVISNVTVSYHSPGTLSTLFPKKVIHNKPSFASACFLRILPF